MSNDFVRLARLIRQRIETPVGPAHSTWFDAIDRNLLEQMNRCAISEMGVEGKVLEFETQIDDDDKDDKKVKLRIDGFRCQQAFSVGVFVSEDLFIRKRIETGPWVVIEEHDVSKQSLLCLLDEWFVFCGDTSKKPARYKPPKCDKCQRTMNVKHKRVDHRVLVCKNCDIEKRERIGSK